MYCFAGHLLINVLSFEYFSICDVVLLWYDKALAILVLEVYSL